ncbi:hypothetical protein [Saccharomonospora marina]|nr:hypothetical protein [Saccharomonospora marina]
MTMSQRVAGRKPSPVPRERDEDLTEDQDTATTETAGAPQRRREATWSARRRLVTVLLAVLTCVAGAGTWYLATQHRPADVRPDAARQGGYRAGTIPSQPGQAAVHSAVRRLPEVLSSDFRRLDENLRRARTHLTPRFRRIYTETFNSVVRPAAQQHKSVIRTVISGAGLVRLSEDGGARAVLVVFVEQLSAAGSGESAGEPRVSQERVNVTMANVDGQWLVDDVVPF